MSFEQLGLSAPLLKALKTEGYTTPTPIQEQAIPHLLEGRDLLGCAQTGTGKTAAFGLPILHLLSQNNINTRGYKHIRALILTPTRELALQIHESLLAYGRHTGLKADVIFGGVSQHTQVKSLEVGADILVATPGRLLDLMNQGHVFLDYLEVFVLDEADRMLDMGFIHDVKRVIRELPRDKQTLFFSATMPPVIAELSRSLLHDPVRVEVTPVSSTAERVDQAICFVRKTDKPLLLEHLLKQGGNGRTLVFARTKHGADKIVKGLKKANIQAAAIHGDKSQTARQAALGSFKSNRLKVLIATDIAARGIDVDNLERVINYDLPNVPETYVHRIGRTGRAGSSGLALSFCDAEERAYLKDITKLIGKQIPVYNHPFEMAAAAVPATSAPDAAVHGNPARSGNNRRPQGGGGNRSGRNFRRGPRNPGQGQGQGQGMREQRD